jgi:hypothetical protein
MYTYIQYFIHVLGMAKAKPCQILAYTPELRGYGHWPWFLASSCATVKSYIKRRPVVNVRALRGSVISDSEHLLW